MRRAAGLLIALVVGLAAVVGLIAVFNSRDDSQLASEPAPGPGRPYRGEPVLSPALQDLVKRGNVVLLYRDKPPAEPAQSGRELIEAGQGIVVDNEPTLKTAYAAVSRDRIQTADETAALQPFIDHWLGG